MKVRVGIELGKKLRWQHDYMGDGAGAVFARAMRKYRRLGEPELELYEESTYQGTVITINPKKLPPVGHGPRVPAVPGDGYFSGAPLSGSPRGGAVLPPASEDDVWSADRIRALLWWHLAGIKDTPPARFVPPGVPGRDWVTEGMPDMIEAIPFDINHLMKVLEGK